MLSDELTELTTVQFLLAHVELKVMEQELE